MRTNDLRTALRSELVQCTGNIYYGQAPEDAAFPYAIFTCDVVSKIDGVPLCEVEINVVDYGRDSAVCESICDAIEAQLDHKSVFTDTIYFTTYFERRSPVMSEDRNIIRRRMVFPLYYYER